MTDRPAVAALRQEWEQGKERGGFAHKIELRAFVERLLAALEAPPSDDDASRPVKDAALALLTHISAAMVDVAVYPESFSEDVGKLRAALGAYDSPVRGEAPPAITDAQAWELWEQLGSRDVSGFASKGELADWVRAVVGRYVRGEAPPEPCPHIRTSPEGTSYCTLAEAGPTDGDPNIASTNASRALDVQRGVVPAPPPEPQEPGSSSPNDLETLGDFWRGDVTLTEDERRWVRQALDVQEPAPGHSSTVPCPKCAEELLRAVPAPPNPEHLAALLWEAYTGADCWTERHGQGGGSTLDAEKLAQWLIARGVCAIPAPQEGPPGVAAYEGLLRAVDRGASAPPELREDR